MECRKNTKTGYVSFAERFNIENLKFCKREESTQDNYLYYKQNNIILEVI